MRRGGAFRTSLRAAACYTRWAAMLAALLLPHQAAGQVRWSDLVFTMGGSAQRYTGNFSAVTVAVVDSTDQATAAGGEIGVRGTLVLLERERQRLTLELDGGVRQAAALGFRLRDYAPREWVGSSSLEFQQTLGSWATGSVRGGVDTRSVRDRPPMPLFMQPGYATVNGAVGLLTRSFQGVAFDLVADIESADYRALKFVPQLDLLDRRAAGFELGAALGESSMIRFFGGVRWSEYGHQGSFDADDPFRRDRTVRAGLRWRHVGELIVLVGLEGTLNRSNSNRPEYDALSVSAELSAPLPGQLTLSVLALLTTKSYVNEPNFALLVPGEEADNASIAYAELVRSIRSNLDGGVRLGWTRAETDIGNAYYQRFGLSVFLNYRPNDR
ncbi:MAG: hypothetical protein IIB36_01590 [Gemmatimonadetes bacterium]|nr:hypothetical protein [Gemmatimonadota bacterium]